MVTRAVMLAALVAVTGCLEPNLVACGDLSCPEGTTCLVDRCVTAGQLAACASSAEGAVCTVEGAVGRCGGGACEPVGCGNGHVDPGEVCDDGNTSYGDGCSGDCRSVETCGNGIVDVSAGESCDCGDAVHKPDRCRSPNSDSPDAECSSRCELRYCGDGKIDTLEQCDGSLLGGQTCSDFGYYHGELGCSTLCRFDTNTCAGRCGDQVVEPGFGEFCDGAPPPGSCITYGFDAGTLGCSAACTPNVARCEPFGWRQLDGSNVRSLWASNTDVLVVGTDGNARMVINGIAQTAPLGTTYRVAAGAGMIGYAIGDTQVAMWSGTVWSTLPVGWAASATPTAAWASASFGLYVVAGGGLWRYAGGTWTDQGLTGVIGVTGDPMRAIAWTASSASLSTGTTWTVISPPSIGTTTITGFASSGPVWWLGTSSANVWKGGPGQPWEGPIAVEPFTQLAASGTGDLVISPSMRRVFVDGRASAALAPPANVATIAVSVDGGIVIGGTSGSYRLRTGAWSARTFIADMDFLSDAFTYHITTRGTRQVFSSYPWISDDGIYFYYDYGALGMGDFAEAVDGIHVYAVDFGSGAGLWATDPDTADSIEVASGTFNELTITHSGALTAGGLEVVARGAMVAWNAGWATWPVTGFDVTAVDELSDGTIVGLAKPLGPGMSVVVSIDTLGVITQLTGSASATPWRGLYVAPDNTIFAVGGDTVWSLAPGAAAPVISHVTGADLATIGGTGPQDLFVAGRPLPFSAFTGMSHWDGTAWTSVHLPDGHYPIKLYATSSLVTYVIGRNFYDLPRVVLW